MDLPYLFTIVPFEADNLLHQDDIPRQSNLLTFSINIPHRPELHQPRDSRR